MNVILIIKFKLYYNNKTIKKDLNLFGSGLKI
jgi:hypothetical protein